ncbi:helix-turn-helix domain-containing protein (plasmid) [Rhizobium sp. CB3171]|uniref:helix-turn-helix domain-containing protein n=1 Tax=Rhizobium sp. CB3171 TaxID=3039157 RepID=UPI0024B15280|nr:helix-turn-helix domain-containing protein [Rhizobium sp. CB3171]WFU06887.1 helix-turn-helix domain-containing protein [Rhizobium sp. CB3171]
MQSWTTVGTIAKDPFVSWRDSLATAFVRLDPLRVNQSPFVGRIVQARSNTTILSRVDASAHGVSRRREHIGSTAQEIAFVNLQISGRGLTCQHDREIVTLPGDIAIADTLYPFDIVHRTGFSLYSIAVARRSLPDALLNSGVLRLSKNETSREIGGLIQAYARLLLSDGGDLAGRPLLAGHILELLSIGTERASDDQRRGPLRLDLILDYARQHHGDPNLSAEKAARVFGVSPRYIHRLLAPTGQPFAEHLKEIRLDASARLLGARPDEPITAIALACGFSDISYFSRAFRQRFAESPTEYRRRILIH